MRLVHAARDDVATMIVQEEEIYEFDRNILKSGGRGPSVSEHAAKDKSQQIDVAVDCQHPRQHGKCQNVSCRSNKSHIIHTKEERSFQACNCK